MGRSQVSFSGALLPPLKQKSKKKRKNRKRPGDRPNVYVVKKVLILLDHVVRIHIVY